MNEKAISEVIFLEVKSGASKTLTGQEKRLKEAVQNGRVRWVEFDIP
jgi:predicted Holliday junction resolvase-like endonuclease